MIRFCDKDVFCVEYGRINRSELLRYFLDGNLDEVVCVLDADGRYFGHITYQALIQNEEIEQAIQKDCLVLDKDIWKNGRLLFAICKAEFSVGGILLPVVNRNQQLLCFAYEDQDANRNLRMLRELQEKPNAFQFKDVYPECKCVKIQEFNELAYFFSKYLLSQKISVQVEGSMWKEFLKSDNQEYLDYNCMTIYAEGVWNRPSNWTENLLRSVSVEFECIDHIYEENIKAGIIKNADKDSVQFLEYLRNSDQVVILGTDIAALDTYDYFKKKGIETSCFASDKYDDRGRILFGKKVLKIIDVMAEYSQPKFVSPYEKGSAWGMGETDWFEYMGYGRNKNFFLLKDYMEIQSDGLKTVLEGRKIILAGDIWLCEKLAAYFDEAGVFGKNEFEYIVMQDVYFVGDTWLNIANMEELKKDALCLIAMPEYFELETRKEWKERKSKIITYLKSYGIVNYTDYFSYMESFIDIEKETECKYKLECLYPKKIVLGSINHHCGNLFFRGLLDNHPFVIMMDWNFLSKNLFWFCICLSGRKAREISSLFLQIYQFDWKGERLHDIDAFIEKMNYLLEQKDTWTSQELFIILHIAYMYMYGKNLDNAEDMVIYWEPHSVIRSVLEDCVQWLGTKAVPCDIINIVRNICKRNGSNIKGIFKMGFPGRGGICHVAIEDCYFERKSYRNSRRVVVRFEDLKCRPEEELRRICQEWNIPWSKSLMHTTVHGEEQIYNNANKFIKDFDLTPVYDTYQEYFSEFDKFKLTLICMPWQKMYGYPYVNVTLFSRRELQEMFLKEFRFMDKVSFETERQRLVFNIGFQDYVRKRLQRIRLQSMESGE